MWNAWRPWCRVPPPKGLGFAHPASWNPLRPHTNFTYSLFLFRVPQSQVPCSQFQDSCSKPLPEESPQLQVTETEDWLYNTKQASRATFSSEIRFPCTKLSKFSLFASEEDHQNLSQSNRGIRLYLSVTEEALVWPHREIEGLFFVRSCVVRSRFCCSGKTDLQHFWTQGWRKIRTLRSVRVCGLNCGRRSAWAFVRNMLGRFLVHLLWPLR